MRFGKTNEERYKEQHEQTIIKVTGERHFAWFPVRLHNGQLIWGRYYYRYYHALLREDGRLSIWSSSPDTYSPMFDAYEDMTYTQITGTYDLNGKNVELTAEHKADLLAMRVELSR